MSPRKLRLLEDKALRDAAKLNIAAYVELFKAEAKAGGLSNRVAEAVTEYLETLGEGALDMARENKGQVAGGLALGIAGLAAWIYRDTIFDMIDGFLAAVEEDGDEDGAEADPEHPAA